MIRCKMALRFQAVVPADQRIQRRKMAPWLQQAAREDN